MWATAAAVRTAAASSPSGFHRRQYPAPSSPRVSAPQPVRGCHWTHALVCALCAPMQDAGADALELNLYRVAADPRRSAGEMEAADLELIAAVPRVYRDPAHGQTEPVLLRLRELRRFGRAIRCPRPGAVQSVLPAGPRPRCARGRAAARVERALGERKPGHGREPIRIRARELHANASIVGRASGTHPDRSDTPRGVAPRELTRRRRRKAKPMSDARASVY